MSERPTPAEVDLALMVAQPGADIGPNVACVLAAEVRALREELGQERGAVKPVLRAQIRELEAIVARVETLCDEAERPVDVPVKVRCVAVEALRAALRSER